MRLLSKFICYENLGNTWHVSISYSSPYIERSTMLMTKPSPHMWCPDVGPLRGGRGDLSRSFSSSCSWHTTSAIIALWYSIVTHTQTAPFIASKHVKNVVLIKGRPPPFEAPNSKTKSPGSLLRGGLDVSSLRKIRYQVVVGIQRLLVHIMISLDKDRLCPYKLLWCPWVVCRHRASSVLAVC